MDEPASDLIPHEQEYQFDAGRPCKKRNEENEWNWNA